MKLRSLLTLTTSLLLASLAPAQITFTGKEGPGKGKKVVLLAGDEEYRSEEAMPMLAKLLSERHGFDCTVVFSINPTTGEIDPNESSNMPGMEALDEADVCVMSLRFRAPKDEQMKHFAEYLAAGKPFIALRTSTHAFNYPKGSNSPYAKFSWGNGDSWKQGFGEQVLGETWVSHWGAHKKEATRGVIEPSAKDNTLLRGVTDIFGTTDVYEAAPPADSTILMRGLVLKGMNPTDEPADYMKKGKSGEIPVNSPPQPIAWTREYKNESGKTNKVLTTTMGAATDLTNVGLRRLVVNATYAFTGLEVPASANVDVVGEYNPTFYGFKGFIAGKKPADYAK
jgi:hypothetical protein